MGGCKCVVPGCNSVTDNVIHFFHMPVFEKQRCLQWLYNLNLLDLKSLTVAQLKNRVICELHFTDNMFMNSNNNKLKSRAVPTLCGTGNTDIQAKLIIPAKYSQKQFQIPPEMKKKLMGMKFEDFLETTFENPNTIDRMQVEYTLDQMCDEALQLKEEKNPYCETVTISIEGKPFEQEETVVNKLEPINSLLAEKENQDKKVRIVSLEKVPPLGSLITGSFKKVNPEKVLLKRKSPVKIPTELPFNTSKQNSFQENSFQARPPPKPHKTVLNFNEEMMKAELLSSEPEENFLKLFKNQNKIESPQVLNPPRTTRSLLKKNYLSEDKQEISSRIGEVEHIASAVPDKQTLAEEQFSMTKAELKIFMNEVLKESSIAKKLDENCMELRKIKESMKKQEKCKTFAVGTQTSCKDATYKKFLFLEIAKFLSSETKDSLYSELFIDVKSPVPPKKRRTAKSRY